MQQRHKFSNECQPTVSKATKHNATRPKAYVLQQCNGSTKTFCGHSNNEHVNRTEESCIPDLLKIG